MTTDTSTTTILTKPKIVIIGAGFFGIALANRLAKTSKDKYKIILISKSSYTYFLISSIRVPVFNDPEGTIIPLKEVVNDDVEIVKDTVVDFDKSKVVLEKGGELDFAALVIATGSKWPEPIGTTHEFGDNYKEYFEKQHENIEKAKHIVLVGGGFNNVELGGELFDRFEKQLKDGTKKITLIHSSDKLLKDDGSYTNHLRDQVTGFYKEQSHFNLVLDTRASYEELEDGTYEVTLENTKETFNADVLYHNIGVIPSVPENNFEGLTDSNGFIKVKETFQISAGGSYANIFAVGDVNDFEYKGLGKRDLYRDVLFHNVVKIVDAQTSGTKATDLKTASKGLEQATTAVSVGKRNGFGQIALPWIGTIRAPQWLIVSKKSKDLRVPFAKEALAGER